MPRPRALVEAQLQTQLSRTRQAMRQVGVSQAADTTKRLVAYQLAGESRKLMVNEYSTSAQRLFAQSLEATLRDIPEDTANLLLKAVNAVERSTIGSTPAERRDNEDLRQVMREFAEKVNNSILESYLASFSGRSYRTGDDSRRSGGIERFLRKKTIASAVGQDLVVSMASAVNDDDVPHIFRLNYGTRSLAGADKPGASPPRFRLSLVPGASGQLVTLGDPGDRRPGFFYPGGNFSYRLSVGGAGQVQLFRASEYSLYRAAGIAGTSSRNAGGRGPRPSQGIAPSYFVERGVAAAARELPGEYQELLAKWRRRVQRLRVSSGEFS